MSAPTLEDSAAKPEKMSRFHIVGKVLSHESDEQREKDKAEEKLKKQEEKEKARKAKEKKRYYKLHPEEAYKDATLSEEERFKLWNKAKDEERKRGSTVGYLTAFNKGKGGKVWAGGLLGWLAIT